MTKGARSTEKAWNPRFVAFAKASGYASPEEMPRGAETNAAFMGWISRQKVAFAKALPEAMLGDTVGDHDAFTTFCERPSVPHDER